MRIAECRMRIERIKFRNLQSEFRNGKADTSSADRPGPQTNDRIFPREKSPYGHPSLNDYLLFDKIGLSVLPLITHYR